MKRSAFDPAQMPRYAFGRGVTIGAVEQPGAVDQSLYNCFVVDRFRRPGPANLAGNSCTVRDVDPAVGIDLPQLASQPPIEHLADRSTQFGVATDGVVTSSKHQARRLVTDVEPLFFRIHAVDL